MYINCFRCSVGGLGWELLVGGSVKLIRLRYVRHVQIGYGRHKKSEHITLYHSCAAVCDTTHNHTGYGGEGNCIFKF